MSARSSSRVFLHSAIFAPSSASRFAMLASRSASRLEMFASSRANSALNSASRFAMSAHSSTKMSLCSAKASSRPVSRRATSLRILSNAFSCCARKVFILSSCRPRSLDNSCIVGSPIARILSQKELQALDGPHAALLGHAAQTVHYGTTHRKFPPCRLSNHLPGRQVNNSLGLRLGGRVAGSASCSI